MGLLWINVEIIFDRETLLFPSAAFVHDVQQGQVASRSVGEFYLLHSASLPPPNGFTG
jgi:hypothetical protein